MREITEEWKKEESIRPDNAMQLSFDSRSSN